jgi:hypothetical protein
MFLGYCSIGFGDGMVDDTTFISSNRLAEGKIRRSNDPILAL